jgi:hypothetical protein
LLKPLLIFCRSQEEKNFTKIFESDNIKEQGKKIEKNEKILNIRI